MSFGTPALLALLALVPLTAAGLFAVHRWQTQAAARYAGSRPPGSLVAMASGPRWSVAAALLTAAVALAALAAARPQAGSRETPVEKAGIDLMLVLDVSQSMDARDVEPSRLARAQAEVLSLLDRLHGDRAGLVIFGRSALLRSPLSTDLRAVAQQVESASRDQGLLQPGTALAAAIDVAVDALAGSPSPAAIGGPVETGGRLSAATRSRVILVVSDGEDHEGRATDAAMRAAQEGIPIYAAGVGSPDGAFIPELDPKSGQFAPKLDPSTGQPVITRLDEGLLRRLAGIGDGRYVALEGSGRPLASLADDFADLEKTLFAVAQERRPIERFQWFALAALAALALEGIVAARRRLPSLGWTPALASLTFLGLIGAACAASAHSLNEKGNRFYSQGSYAEALDAYQRAQAERPDLGQITHNAANALHRLGRFQRAAEEARRALNTAEGPLAAQLYYGLGNHLFRAGSLEEALNAYKHALMEDPSDADAKYNLEVVLRLLQVRPPPEGTQPGQGQPGQPGGGEEGPGQPQPEGEAGRAERIQRDLQQALAGIEEEFSIEKALRVLDLLREQQLTQQRAGERAPVAGPDY